MNPSSLTDSHCFSYLIKNQYYRVDGEKARSFLQGQLTQDILLLSPHHWLSGAHCDVKGRILAIYDIFESEENVYLTLPSEVASIAIPRLNTYAKFSRIQLTPMEEWTTLYCWGNSLTLNAIFQKKLNLSFSYENKMIREKESLWLYSYLEPFAHYEIIAPLSYCKKIQEILAPEVLSSSLVMYDAWNILRGVPRIFSDTVGLFTPHELNLPARHMVSFEKGCYTGQEIIARMEHRGKLKSKLYYTSYEESTPPPPRGTPLKQNHRVCGTLVMAASPTPEQHVLLVLLQEDALQGSVDLNGLTLKDFSIP